LTRHALRLGDDAVTFADSRHFRMRRSISFAIVFCAFFTLFACGTGRSSDMPDLATDAKIDLHRYMGAWNVIANIPYFAERGKVAARDVYTLDGDGNIATTYVYRKSFDEPEKTMGSLGIVQPDSNNARWIVRFFWLIRADYMILEVAPDYSWALIGQPSRKLGWVLARDPMMDDALYKTLLDKFRGFGYDTGKFMRVPQHREQIGLAGFQ
jgi:apolipoprotein D and lipocalin family protein